MVYGFLFFFIIAVGVVCIANTRAARLKRLARQFRYQYISHVEHVLTEAEARQSVFAGQGKHSFFHIVTWQDAGAFVRFSDDRLIPADSASACPVYTVVTAELTRGSFQPFVLMPRRPQEPVFLHPALSRELAEKYLLSAPDDFKFPEEVLGFLKAAVQPFYLELTPHAFIYHEFSLLPVSQVQNIRLRVRQLISVLVQKPTPKPAASSTQQAAVAARPVSPMSEAELQAQVLLKLQGASSSYGHARSGGGSGRWIFGIFYLLAIAGLLFFARYALMHWIHR